MSKFYQNWKNVIPVFVAIALLLTACGGSGSKNVTVNITLNEFSIASSLTTFSQGVTYHFVIVNKGSANHEFRIMPPDPNSSMSTDQINTATLASIGSTDLPAGATKTLDYTFTKAYPAGALEFACHMPDHYESGMHLAIVVN